MIAGGVEQKQPPVNSWGTSPSDDDFLLLAIWRDDSVSHLTGCLDSVWCHFYKMCKGIKRNKVLKIDEVYYIHTVILFHCF